MRFIFILTATILPYSSSIFAEAPREAIAAHQACLHKHSGPYCFERYYQPIAAQCNARKQDCLPDIEAGDPGGLSFKRCFKRHSCNFAPGLMSFRLESGGQRAEVADPFLSPYEELTEYHFSLRIPSETVLTTDNGSIVIAQLHANNGQSPTFALRFKSNDDLAITIRHLIDGDDSATNGHEVHAFRQRLERDRWYNFAIKARSGPAGTLQVAIDGQNKLIYNGPVGYKDRVGYFKFGIYDYTQSLKSDFELQFRSYWRGPPDSKLNPALAF